MRSFKWMAIHQCWTESNEPNARVLARMQQSHNVSLAGAWDALRTNRGQHDLCYRRGGYSVSNKF